MRVSLVLSLAVLLNASVFAHSNSHSCSDSIPTVSAAGPADFLRNNNNLRPTPPSAVARHQIAHRSVVPVSAPSSAARRPPQVNRVELPVRQNGRHVDLTYEPVATRSFSDDDSAFLNAKMRQHRRTQDRIIAQTEYEQSTHDAQFPHNFEDKEHKLHRFPVMALHETLNSAPALPLVHQGQFNALTTQQILLHLPFNHVIDSEASQERQMQRLVLKQFVSTHPEDALRLHLTDSQLSVDVLHRERPNELWFMVPNVRRLTQSPSIINTATLLRSNGNSGRNGQDSLMQSRMNHVSHVVSGRSSINHAVHALEPLVQEWYAQFVPMYEHMLEQYAHAEEVIRGPDHEMGRIPHSRDERQQWLNRGDAQFKHLHDTMLAEFQHTLWPAVVRAQPTAHSELSFETKQMLAQLSSGDEAFKHGNDAELHFGDDIPRAQGNSNYARMLNKARRLFRHVETLNISPPRQRIMKRMLFFHDIVQQFILWSVYGELVDDAQHGVISPRQQRHH